MKEWNLHSLHMLTALVLTWTMHTMPHHMKEWNLHNLHMLTALVLTWTMHTMPHHMKEWNLHNLHMLTALVLTWTDRTALSGHTDRVGTGHVTLDLHTGDQSAVTLARDTRVLVQDPHRISLVLDTAELATMATVTALPRNLLLQKTCQFWAGLFLTDNIARLEITIINVCSIFHKLYSLNYF